MQFTIKQLRYFVAAAERASVTGAARAIHVSQPSISAAIAQLEERFELQLFVRHHAQGLSLTPAGRRFLLEARNLLGHAAELQQSARGMADELAGDLDIGCFITFAPLLMPALLRAFSARFPDITVRLHEDHTEALIQSLRGGRFDLALTYDLNLGPDVTFEPLAEVPLHVVLPPRHRLARAAAASLQALIGEPLVLLGLPQSRDYFLSIFYGLGLQPRLAYETPSFEMLRGLVANGHGYALMHSRPASDRALDGERLVYRPVAEKIRPTRLGIARLAGSRSRRMATAFSDFCKEFVISSSPMTLRLPGKDAQKSRTAPNRNGHPRR
ncbi:MAG TPA: LysR substrate-binding domain-containing protein [Methylomirabilota bacterium]|nr:LysR substrate-binding domain-containing protein [Methylomirabilota bacterium]